MAGDDPEAMQVASILVRDAGFDPVVVGSLQRSKLFEQGGPLYGAQMSADEMREIADVLASVLQGASAGVVASTTHTLLCSNDTSIPAKCSMAVLR